VSYGWNSYWKNIGPMLLITIVIIAVSLVINIIGQVANNTAVSVLFAVIGWIVGLLLAFGLIRASLAVTRGEKPEVGMLFQGDNFGPYILASILFGIGAAIGFILCIIPGIIFVVAFWFYGYIICEAPPGISATDALSRAAALSKDKRWELFGLGVVLFLINLVGALLCGIGLLFTYGITALAVAYAYRALNGQAVVQP
jgi:hypothetical protein